MKPFLRHTAAALTVGALVFAVAGCNKPADKTAADKTAKADDKSAGGTENIPGLPTEKDKVSYMIGMSLGKNLKPVKDEIDLGVVVKAVKSSLAEEKLLMDDKQAMAIAEAFGQKMQAKQIAEMMAKAKKNQADGEAFLAANAKKPGVQTTASGLQYQVITAGTGPKPKPTDVVRVHYKGALLDGKQFDSSYDRGEPAVFPVSGVVPGWQEGIALMPVGSKYKLWVPAKLGYGEQGTPGGPIPPNSTLAFEVELLEIVKQPAK